MSEFTSLNGYTVKDEVARNIAKGRNQAVAFESYASMIEALNGLDNDTYKTGQNIYIGTVGVPDLWVYSVESIMHTFEYTSDEDVVAMLEENTTIQCGHYQLAMLEGQKVDLTELNTAVSNLTTTIETDKQALASQIGASKVGTQYHKLKENEIPPTGQPITVESELTKVANAIKNAGLTSMVDFVVEECFVSNFYVRKWNSGKCDARCYIAPTNKEITTAWGTSFICDETIALPSGLFTSIGYANVTIVAPTEIPTPHISKLTNSSILLYVSNSKSATCNVGYNVYVLGTWK